MSVVSVNYSFQIAEFMSAIREFGVATGRDFAESVKIQSRLLAKELMERTPPFGGKLVEKMLMAKGASLGYKNAVIADEDYSAKQVGERRVEKDIRRVIYGVKGASQRVKENPIVAVGQAHAGNAGYDPNRVEFGVRQKCEGRDAVRIFATSKGEVYGVDLESFKPSASVEEMAKTHEAHRGKRGRVTMAGSQDKIVGRWRWLSVMVTKEALVNKYIALKKKAVGQGKGGWAKGFSDLGGRISSRGWVGRHMGAGDCLIRVNGDDVNIVLVNRSKWASGGDDQRIIEKSLERRAEDMKTFSEGIINGKWKRR